MKIEDPRALMLRLIVGELLARPGDGPLAPKYFVRMPARRPSPTPVPAPSRVPPDDEPSP